MEQHFSTILLSALIQTDLVYMQAFTSGPPSPSLFQCQNSSEEIGQVFIPNINIDFNHEEVASLRTDGRANLTKPVNSLTYIFTIPPVSAQRNCSGTVIAIDYCYRVGNEDLGLARNIFNFLLLTQDRHQFIIDMRRRIRSTPSNSSCSATLQGLEQICCDREVLNIRRRFQIPPSDFTYGILVRSSQLLAFTESATQYNFEQFQVTLGNSGRPNSTFTVTEMDRFTNQSLLLLRFTLEPDEPNTQPVATTTQQTSDPTSSDELDTGESSTGINGFNTIANNKATTKKSDNIIASLSGIVGASAVTMLVLMVLILLMLLRSKKKRHCEVMHASSHTNTTCRTSTCTKYKTCCSQK